jgi:uncharacterized iron-regulated membrane protein
MRALPLRLHRWAGLATALFLLLAGLTGSLLAFKNELEGVINPRLFIVTPPPGKAADDFLDPFVLHDRLAARYPQARTDHLSFPVAGRSQMFYLMPRTNPSTGQPYPLPQDQVFVDPYTGEVLGARKWGELFSAEKGFERANVMPFIWRVHEALALPHPWGKIFMGVVALVWTLDGFIGLWLTFPRGRPFLKKWKVAWQIKRGASRQRLNLDVHRAGALWLWVVLLVFAWSSVMLNLRELVYEPVMSQAFEFKTERPPRLPAPRNNPRLAWREAHERARHTLQAMAREQGFSVKSQDSLWYRPAFGAYLYRTHTSLDIRDDGGASDLWIDGDSGIVRRIQFEGKAASGDTISNWLRVLHTGLVWGAGYRAALATLGVAVAVLSVTGVIIWNIKRRSRHLARQRAAQKRPRPPHPSAHQP